ncbi:class I SAM-dependent methyltransferase [Lacticaseibacillus jixianensis]|uniref:Class I SAM-dependent methyltransferase n=1 Tax=Lacticaseibacillus jixianensis TaxID=2486012 RepID=A0ABW4B744_9LACO|nr:methyltransferase domain-containing protein [Lacticaseibacillus jixianensis]
MTNSYDDPNFFDAYAKMPRSRDGLKSAGEWPDFQRLLPPLTGQRVLDLGCGYGWHCRYAAAHGAASVLGIDSSQRMLAAAKARTASAKITYELADLATFERPAGSFDVVLSSLAFHYVQDLTGLMARVTTMLSPGGTVLFTIEHPLFTAEGHEQWVATADGRKVWPVDRYFDEGLRKTTFLGQQVPKYHHTLATIMNSLLASGLTLTGISEPRGSEADIAENQPWTRAPMMLIVRGQKA